MFTQAQAAPLIQTISPSQAKDWLEQKKAILIDVREPFEHASQKIADATLHPFSKLSPDLIKTSAGQKIIIHCQSGARSSQACQKISQAYPDLEIYNLEGGILAWAAAGYDVVKNTQMNVMSIDRQVRIVIGVFIIIAALLTHFMATQWLIFVALIGAGLIFSGFSGLCGLALILAKMPWNLKIKG